MRIKTTSSKLAGEIRIPASKSHTIRALAIAALADGESVLKNPLLSSDTLSCIEGIKKMGAEVVTGFDVTVKGMGGIPKNIEKLIDVGNSGTTLRILTAVAALSDKPVTFDGDESIRTRQMEPLLNALAKLGAQVNSKNGKCPFTIQGPVKGGQTTVDGMSSQFLSALLLACPLANEDTEIIVNNLQEKPYVQMTMDWLDQQSIKYKHEEMEKFIVKGKQKYNAIKKDIPADFSSATFSLCAAAITGSDILIQGLDFDDPQGDKEVFVYLEKMGLEIKRTSKGVQVKAGTLKGADLDINATPDALPALAVVGCFAEGTTRLLNVPQARFKECDRIKAMATELKKMGADIHELEDGLEIKQSNLKGTQLKGYHDHRMVMALAIAGLAAEGTTIVDTAESIKITYPSFMDDMKALGAKIEEYNL